MPDVKRIVIAPRGPFMPGEPITGYVGREAVEVKEFQVLGVGSANGDMKVVDPSGQEFEVVRMAPSAFEEYEKMING